MSLNNYSTAPEANWFYFTPSSDCLDVDSTCNFLKQALSFSTKSTPTLEGNVSRACVALFVDDVFIIGSGMLYPQKASSKGSITFCNPNSSMTIPSLTKLAFKLGNQEGLNLRIIYAMKATAPDLDADFANNPKFNRFDDYDSLLEPMMTPVFQGVHIDTLGLNWSKLFILKFCCPARLFEEEHFLLFLQRFVVLSNVLIAVRKHKTNAVKGFYSLSNFHSLEVGDEGNVQVVLIAPNGVQFFQERLNSNMIHIALDAKKKGDEYVTLMSDYIDTARTLELLQEVPPKKITPCADGLPSLFFMLPRMVTMNERKWHMQHDRIAYTGDLESFGEAEPKSKATPKKKKIVQRAIKSGTPAEIVAMINALYKRGKDANLVFSEFLESAKKAEVVKTEQVSDLLSDSDEESEVEVVAKPSSKNRKRTNTEEKSSVSSAAPSTAPPATPPSAASRRKATSGASSSSKTTKRPAKKKLKVSTSSKVGRKLPPWATNNDSDSSSSESGSEGGSEEDDEVPATPSSSRTKSRRNTRSNGRRN